MGQIYLQSKGSSPSNQQRQGQNIAYTPSKYFPQCQVPKVAANFQKKACSNPINPQNKDALNQLGQTKAYAESYATLYENLVQSTDNNERGSSQGLSCLNDALKHSKDQLQSSINQINEFIANINQQNKSTINRLNSISDRIKDSAHLLYGNPVESNNVKGKSISDYFSPSCQQTVGKNTLNQFKRRGGLVGIKENLLSDPAQQATNFTNPTKLKKYVNDIKKPIIKNKG